MDSDSVFVLLVIATIGVALYALIADYQKRTAQNDSRHEDTCDYSKTTKRNAAAHKTPANPTEQSWVTIKWPLDHNQRPAGYVVLPGCAGVSVRGVNHPNNDGHQFISEVEERDTPICQIIPNTADSEHPEGFAVYAKANRHAINRRIGFLPKSMAVKIRDEYHPELPLSAEIRAVGVKTRTDLAFVKINVLAPKAKERNKHKRLEP